MRVVVLLPIAGPRMGVVAVQAAVPSRAVVRAQAVQGTAVRKVAIGSSTVWRTALAAWREIAPSCHSLPETWSGSSAATQANGHMAAWNALAQTEI